MNTDFRLVDSCWDKELENALRLGEPALQIICPFIKKRVAERLLRIGKTKEIQVITRFNLADFCEGVSDTEALDVLLARGAQVRGIRNLHSKLYIFGKKRVIVTSANLTESALTRNQEFGFVSEDSAIIGYCRKYFQDLWKCAGTSLTTQRLEEWKKKLEVHLAGGSRPSHRPGLGDEGVDVGEKATSIAPPDLVAEAPQAFVKFFGINSDRANYSLPVILEIRRAGCHWACSYPKGKRPRQVEDGAVMFMGRLVKEPSDIIIFGRAVAMKHRKGRDDATDTDKKLRAFKKDWPHYIRVHHAEFIAGTLDNGISLNALKGELRENSFASTQRNSARGNGNINPHKAYMQQATVQLSSQGFDWLNAEMEKAFSKHGRVTATELEQLDWPTIQT